MGGLALLAKDSGFTVTGSDQNIYPPMSTQLAENGIVLTDGYHAAQLEPAPDCVVVGNALSRGNAAVESMLAAGLDYTSGPEWLARHVLRDRWVLAASGTHGKTSTASMLAWILEFAGHDPGFLIGGVPLNFGVSARLGSGRYFVIEADEYDSAFFDKRAKFIHYRPRTLIINNLEYDHADIFPDLAAIENQFHHLVRCVPGVGVIIRGGGDAIDRVLARGVWTPVCTMTQHTALSEPSVAADACSWRALTPQADELEICSPDGEVAHLTWTLMGEHNAWNATAAITAALSVGVPFSKCVGALSGFAGIKRRLELLGTPGGVAVYDDFAHHPTAIETTLAGLCAAESEGQLVAIIEPRSNTMRMGEHREQLASTAQAADHVLWYQPEGLNWDLSDVIEGYAGQRVCSSVAQIIETVVQLVAPGDRIVVMSNGGFEGLHGRLVARLEAESHP
jgi:UDP-N-acetylmuramate: L-alanyl-gamma-D-glutamyl-meso-diaminopimelate ligase